MKRRAQWLLSALCLCACDVGAKPAVPRAALPPTAATEPAPEPATMATMATIDPPLEAAPDTRGLRFRVVSAPAPATTHVEGVGDLLAVGAAPAKIDLEDGTRLDAAPHSQLCAFAFAKTLLVVSGQLHVTHLPDAERAGAAPARITSLTGALETSPGADVALRVDAQASGPGAGQIAYRTQLSLLRGTVTWVGLDERAKLENLQLSLGSPLPKPAEGMQWLTAVARATSDQRFQALRRATLTAADVDHTLDASLTELAALRERGHVLLARVSPRHAALAKDTTALPAAEGSTREYQRALVEHAGLRQAQAEQLLLAAERSLLAALVACGASATGACASLQSWSERFSARVADLL